MGKGSANLPAMLQLDFNPTQDPNAPVLACLVGKGLLLTVAATVSNQVME